jgi:hypothetical protein
MPQVGFEPTTPVSEPAKTVYAVDSAAAVICKGRYKPHKKEIPYGIDRDQD